MMDGWLARQSINLIEPVFFALRMLKHLGFDKLAEKEYDGRLAR